MAGTEASTRTGTKAFGEAATKAATKAGTGTGTNRGLIEIHEQTLRRCAWQSWYTFWDKRARRMTTRTMRERENREFVQRIRDNVLRHAHEAGQVVAGPVPADALTALQEAGQAFRDHDAETGYNVEDDPDALTVETTVETGDRLVK